MIALVRLLALLALLAFAAAAFDPVVIAFRDTPVSTRAVELAGGNSATSIMRAGAVVGPRLRDLVLVGSTPSALPTGPFGAQAVLPIEPLPIEPDDIELRALRRAAVGRPLALSLRCLAENVALTAKIEVRDSLAELAAETLQLEGGKPVEVAFVPLREGRVDVRIEIKLGEQTLVRVGEFVVEAAPRVLVLESSGVAAAALRAQGVAVELAGEMSPNLDLYAAVVVGAPLTVSMQETLTAAIDDGLGAFVLAPGFGALGEPLHDILPVRPEPVAKGELGGSGQTPSENELPAKPTPIREEQPPSGDTSDASQVSKEPIEVDKRTIAMVLVVDRSWSMGSLASGGRSKMSYAKTSALQSAQALAEGDQVGLVTFGNKGAGRVELELCDVVHKDRIKSGVERLSHGPEYTFLLSGLQHADQLLRPAQAAVKHVVVVTDGEFNTGETMALRRLAFRMFREAKISVTILSIVNDQTQPGFKRDAELITRDGGGEFLPITAAESVPVFVSAEVTRSLDRIGRRPGNTDDPDAPTAPPAADPKPNPDPEPETPKDDPPSPSRLPVRAVAASPVLEPVPIDWPTLGSAVATTAPLDAQVLLVAGDQGWPLLAYGNRGIGRIGAFAADLVGDAGSEMRADESFPARLALWVQHVMRAEPEGEPQLIAMTSTIEPGAPTPAEVRALELLGGAVATREAAPISATVQRTVVSAIPSWALAALAALLLLVLAERLAVLRRRT